MLVTFNKIYYLTERPMANRLLISFTILLFVLLLYSCDTQPTQSSSDPSYIEPLFTLNPVPVPTEQNSHLFNFKKEDKDQSPYSMNFTTLAHTDSDDPYLYHNYEIEFSDQILADADGKTRTIKYGYSIPTAQARKGARLDSDGNAILRIVNQRIPDSDEAEELLRKSTNVFQPGSNLHQLLSEDPDIDFSEYEDEEIILQSGDSCTMIKEAVSCFLNFYVETGDLFVVCYDNACLGDGYGNPEPDPDPPPLPPGPDPGEGGGGSGTPPGDSGSEADICNDPTLIMIPPSCQEEDDEEEEEVEPCETGNEIVDSPEIQTGFATIWENSNADADISERMEDGGWIIQTGNGYEFQRFPAGWARTACGIDIPFNPVNMTLPDNVVGWVHTHPYNVGEDIGEVCLGEGEEYIYPGHASEADIETQAYLAFNATSRNFISNPVEFTTIIIDKDGVRITDGGLGFPTGQVTEEEIEENTTSYEPCGYIINN